MKQSTETHKITFSKKGQHEMTQPAMGKTDLFNCLREMMKDGYDTFHITTIQKTCKTALGYEIPLNHK